MNIPIAFSADVSLQESAVILAADISGTHNHLGLFRYDGGQFQLIREQVFKTGANQTFEELARTFLVDQVQPTIFSIAFAGPVLQGGATATNLDWTIDTVYLREAFQLKAIFLVNDLEATAYGLMGIEPHEVVCLQEGNKDLRGNASILAPGTGLGEAGLYCDGEEYHPFATEGGHSDFAPRDELDDALLKSLRKELNHVSWERVLSGPGIERIYQFLLEYHDEQMPTWILPYHAKGSLAAGVSFGAKKKDILCMKAMALFFKYLATESANLVLKHHATGGIFIAGGVVPKNRDLVDISTFLSHFHKMGRFESFMKQIPIYIVLNEHIALWGAAYYGVLSKRQSEDWDILLDS